MAQIEALKRKLILWIERLRPVHNHDGFMVDAPGGIDDGVDYSQPAIVPAWLRREMAVNQPLHESVLKALREDSAASKYRSQFGEPYANNAPISPVTEDPLLEWDTQTRELVLTNCHAAYARNPLAYAIVTFTTLFVVGDGFNVDCKNKQVEKVIQDFIDHPDNAIREYERQAVTDLQVDGELLLRLAGENGETICAPQRPWELQGITTELGFFRRIKSFDFQRHVKEGDAPTGRTETIPEQVPADEMLFVAINRHAYELRGRPDLYRLLPWLRADTEWLSDRARQSKWRNALLWVVNVANATSAIIAAVAARWRKPPSPGSVAVESANVTVTAATNSAGAADAANDGRAIRLMNIIGALLPEYFFGDGKQANLATATKQELPALTKFEAYQQIMLKQLWTPLLKRVVQNAVEAGLLSEELDVEDADGEPMPPKPEPAAMPKPAQMMPTEAEYEVEDETPNRVKAVESFEVTYEPVTQQDINQLTQALNLQKQNGWIDDTTAMEKLGLDPHMIQKRLKVQKENEAAEMKAGLRPVAPGQERGLGMEPEEPEPGMTNGKGRAA